MGFGIVIQSSNFFIITEIARIPPFRDKKKIRSQMFLRIITERQKYDEKQVRKYIRLGHGI